MLKEFIEHIQETTKPLIHTIDPEFDSGGMFVVTGTGRTVELRPTLDHPDTLHLYSLEALVTMVKTEAANMDAPLYITIPDHLTVRCFGQPQHVPTNPVDVDTSGGREQANEQKEENPI